MVGDCLDVGKRVAFCIVDSVNNKTVDVVVVALMIVMFNTKNEELAFG